ncbi:MAG: peptidoglycan-binding protein [Nocardioidaceae bacterium]
MPVSFPSNPRGLPAPTDWGTALDEPASYQGQSACVAVPSRGIVKLRALALSTYGRGGTSPATPRPCTYGSQSEHKDGRAWDWMLNVDNRADKRAAADFLGWITGEGPSGVKGEMARRLGIMYVIYNRKLWSAYTGSWHAYDGADPHTSHIHISLSWNGARAHTSFWTGRVWGVDYGTCQVFTNQPANAPTAKPRTTPCPSAVHAPLSSTQPMLWIGSAGTVVFKGQRVLGMSPTGVFGADTRRVVLAYQRTQDLPRTGAVDKPTWAGLLPTSQRSSVPDWTPREAASWGRKNAGSPVLQRGLGGRSVYALQVALKMPNGLRNGYFASQTAREVRAFKKAHDLGKNARVGANVWAELPAE